MCVAAGAIGVPGNDDWVYMRAAGSLFRTGSVVMAGHSAAFIGQLVMVQPLLWLSGGDPWAFTAFGLVMGLIGIVSTYLLARRFLGTVAAASVVLLVIAFPGFARETASFMTDVPAYALVVLCLLLGTMWLQGEGGRVTFVASLAAGLLAVSIREFAIAAPATILVSAWARNRADERAWLVGVSSILAAGVVCVLILASSMSGRGAPGAPDFSSASQIGPAFATLAAVLLPAVALGWGRRMATLTRLQVALGAGLVCVALVWPARVLLGDLWDSNGIGGDGLLSGTRDPVIGGAFGRCRG
jgi:4-amino-4-deoxy-L-arabinose transferase-like glycosyltransferase